MDKKILNTKKTPAYQKLEEFNNNNNNKNKDFDFFMRKF